MQITVPYPKTGVELGQGFDPISLTSFGPALAEAPTEHQQVETPQQLVRQVSSESDLSTALSVAAKGSFSGFGADVSASVNAVLESSVSTKSSSYLLTAYYHTRRNIVDLTKATLTPGARQLLKEDPAKFLKTYGFGFAGGTINGGYFTGVASLIMSDMSDKTDVSGELSAAYGGGKADLKAAFSKVGHKYKCEQSYSVQAKGVLDLHGTTTVEKLFENYDTFVKDMAKAEAGVPLGLIVHTWSELDDVNAALEEAGQSWPENYPPESLQVEEYASIYSGLQYYRNGLNAAKSTIVGSYNASMHDEMDKLLNQKVELFETIDSADKLAKASLEDFQQKTTLPADFDPNLKDLLAGKICMEYVYHLDAAYSDIRDVYKSSTPIQFSTKETNTKAHSADHKVLTAHHQGDPETEFWFRYYPSDATVCAVCRWPNRKGDAETISPRIPADSPAGDKTQSKQPKYDWNHCELRVPKYTPSKD